VIHRFHTNVGVIFCCQSVSAVARRCSPLSSQARRMDVIVHSIIARHRIMDSLSCSGSSAACMATSGLRAHFRPHVHPTFLSDLRNSMSIHSNSVDQYSVRIRPRVLRWCIEPRLSTIACTLSSVYGGSHMADTIVENN
jgi:hypothetical protein